MVEEEAYPTQRIWKSNGWHAEKNFPICFFFEDADGTFLHISHGTV